MSNFFPLQPITLCIPLPQSGNKQMLTQYSGQSGQEPPTLRLLCSITGSSFPSSPPLFTLLLLLRWISSCSMGRYNGNDSVDIHWRRCLIHNYSLCSILVDGLSDSQRCSENGTGGKDYLSLKSRRDSFSFRCIMRPFPSHTWLNSQSSPVELSLLKDN